MSDPGGRKHSRFRTCIGAWVEGKGEGEGKVARFRVLWFYYRKKLMPSHRARYSTSLPSTPRRFLQPKHCRSVQANTPTPGPRPLLAYSLKFAPEGLIVSQLTYVLQITSEQPYPDILCPSDHQGANTPRSPMSYRSPRSKLLRIPLSYRSLGTYPPKELARSDLSHV